MENTLFTMSPGFGELSPLQATPFQEMRTERESRHLFLQYLRHLWSGFLIDALEGQRHFLSLLQPHTWHLYESHRPAYIASVPLSEMFEVSQRSVVFVGEAETRIFLGRLAHLLLDRATENIDEAFPVFFDLAAWQPEQPFAEWMLSQLILRFRIPRHIALRWVQANSLIVFFDLSSLLEADQLARLHALDLVQREGSLCCVGRIVRADFGLFLLKISHRSAFGKRTRVPALFIADGTPSWR